MPELTYCPVCGHTPLSVREESGRLRQVCDNCGYVHYVNPVPAVGILIEMDGGVVLIRRSNPPHKGEWTLPSGFIEADESAEEAAIREAEEETGLNVAIIEMAGVNSFPEGPPISGIMIFFRAKPTGGELRGGDDALEAKVFKLDEIPRLPFRTHREFMSEWLTRHQKELPGESGSTDDDETEKPAFFIRPAEPGDIDELRALMVLIPANRHMSRETWMEIGQRFREADNLEVFVAQTRQEPPILIGFIALSIVRALTEGRGLINDMAVLPTYQRRGVGAALLDAVMKRAAQINLCTLVVNSQRANDRAKAFYAGLGFSQGDLMRLKIR